MPRTSFPWTVELGGYAAGPTFYMGGTPAPNPVLSGTADIESVKQDDPGLSSAINDADLTYGMMLSRGQAIPFTVRDLARLQVAAARDFARALEESGMTLSEEEASQIVGSIVQSVINVETAKAGMLREDI